MSTPVVSSGSIRRRLTLQLVGSAAVLAAILFILVQNFARQVSEESQDNILVASATSILDSANIQAGEVLIDIPYAALSMLGNVSDDRVFYRVKTGDKFLTGYADLPEIILTDANQERGFITSIYKGDSIRMVSAVRRLSAGDQPVFVTVSVAQTQNGRADTLASISRTALLFGIGFFIISAGLAILAAQSSVRPLQKLADSVARRGPNDLRPVQSPVPTEMAPLVVSLNSFIARLKTSLARSEDFIAEAAHRVRTPLATVRSQAEIVLHRVERPENRKALKEMIRAVDESSRAASQLLDHAMVTFRADHLEQENFNLADLVSDTVTRIRPVAELRDIQFETQISVVPSTSGDPVLVQSAVQNILDNAVKYSQSDQTVTVIVKALDSYVEVRILDQGTGFPDRDMQKLTNRFTRGENALSTVGSGLGLTIAKEVVEAHRGKLTLTNQEKGSGACVSLFFPI
ncbi:MAG: sensor histidine kinase [Paracoccaceae bacterium]